MSDDILCETCLERGRQRLADVVTENLQMCRDCFDGKPTCRAEEIGGHDDLQAANAQRADRTRQAKLEATRRWRQANADRVREYNRRYQRERYRKLRERSHGEPAKGKPVEDDRADEKPPDD